MSTPNQLSAVVKKQQDVALLLFLLYVTPLCVYLQTLFFATTNAWAAIYILMMVGLMLISGKIAMQVKKGDVLFFIFMLIACVSSLRAGEYLYFMQATLVLIFVWGYTKYSLSALCRYLELLVFFGVACALACIIQELWNGFYVEFVSKLFKAQELETIFRLEEDKGNCGIMPQTANAAICILNAFFILMFKNNSTRKKVFLGIILGLGLLLTGKRAHLFMGAFVYFISFFVGYKGQKEIKMLIVGAIAGGVLVTSLTMIAPFLPENSSIVTGLNTIREFDVNDDEIMHGRELLYAEAILMGNSAPLTGHGWGSFKKTVNYRGDSTDAHNIYLQLYAEQGAIVAVLFVIVAIVLFVTNVRALRALRHSYNQKSTEVRLAKMSFCFMFFFFLYGLTGNGLYNVECLLTLGLGVSILKRVKQVIKV